MGLWQRVRERLGGPWRKGVSISKPDAATAPREQAKPRPKLPTRAELQARLRRGEYLTDVERSIAEQGYWWPRDYDRVIYIRPEEEEWRR